MQGVASEAFQGLLLVEGAVKCWLPAKGWQLVEIWGQKVPRVGPGW